MQWYRTCSAFASAGCQGQLPKWLTAQLVQYRQAETHHKALERNLRLTAALMTPADGVGSSLTPPAAHLPELMTSVHLDSPAALPISPQLQPQQLHVMADLDQEQQQQQALSSTAQLPDHETWAGNQQRALQELLQMASNAPHLSTQCAALRCFGAQFAAPLAQWHASLLQHAGCNGKVVERDNVPQMHPDYWGLDLQATSDLLHACSHPACIEDVRLACANAIAASSMLSQCKLNQPQGGRVVGGALA